MRARWLVMIQRPAGINRRCSAEANSKGDDRRPLIADYESLIPNPEHLFFLRIDLSADCASAALAQSLEFGPDYGKEFIF